MVKHWPIVFDDSRYRTGRITSHYGCRPNPVTGNDENHTGFDLSAPLNTSLICPEDCTILKCMLDQDGLFGNFVVIRTKSGWKWQAWHLAGFNGEVKIAGQKTKLATFRPPGTIVFAGQVLGFTGNTGKNTTGPHVHIRTAQYPNTRQSIDPVEYYGLYERDITDG